MNLDYKNEIEVRQEMLRHFFNSKYHKLRVILFYLKRFTYLMLLRDYKNKFKDNISINKVVKNKNRHQSDLRVLYDFQTFSAQKVGGISRLFYELIKNFSKNSKISPELAIRYADNVYINSNPLFNKLVYTSRPPVNHTSDLLPTAPFLENSFIVNAFRKSLLKIMRLKFLKIPGTTIGSLKPSDYYNYYENNVKVSINFLQKGEFDVFHPTYYDTYFLKYLSNKPFVLTVHDMIHEKFPQYHCSNDIISKQKKILVKKAAKIIAVSNQTKKDLIEIFKIPSEKIVVIPHASSFNGKPKEQKIKLPRKFILFIGTRVGYKNFSFFIKSISLLLRKNKDLFVVCVGDEPASGPFSKDELNHFERLKIKKKMLYFKANDALLHYLYTKATLFAFPTLYEGFGIPILEAFSSKCPVLCSDIPVLREIAKNAAIYFDPKDSKSIYNATNKMLNNDRLRKDLSKIGVQINSEYSWKKTSEMTGEVYCDVLKNH